MSLSSLRNNFRVAFASLKSNKKTIILSTIGLIIAYTIAFQMLLFLFGNQLSILDSYLSGDYSEGLFGALIEEDSTQGILIGPDIEVDFEYTAELPSNDFANNIKANVFSAAEASRTDKLIQNGRISSEIMIRFHFYRYYTQYNEYSIVMPFIGLCNEDIDFLQSYLFLGGYSAFNGSNALLICYDNECGTIFVPPDRQFNISLLAWGSDLQYNISLADSPIQIPRVETGSNEIYRRLKRRFGDYLFSDNFPGVLVTGLDTVADIFDNTGLIPNYFNYYLNIDINYAEFGLFSIKNNIRKIIRFENSLYSELTSDPFIIVDFIYARITDNLEIFSEDFLRIQIIALSLTIPPISIAIFMISFSFNLVRSQNVHQINLMKVRGAKNKQIAFTLILEMLLSTVFALIVSPVISLPFLRLISRTSGFLQFENEMMVSYKVLAFSWDTIAIIGIAGVALALIINFPRIIALSRLKVYNIVGEKLRKKKPLWRRIYFDFFLGGLALIDLTLYLVALNYFSEDTRLIFVSIFGTTTPIFLVIAISLLIARLFNPIVKWIGNKVWEVKGGTLALSIKNLAHREKQTARAVILIVLTVTFGVVSAVVPSTIDFNVRERWSYIHGADVVVYNANIDDQTFINELRTYPYVEGVTPAMTLFNVNSNFGWDMHLTSLMGIDPDTFLEGAFMRERKYKFSDNLESLLEQLNTPGNVLLQKSNLANFGLRIGETFGLLNEYQIIGTFKYFPNLIQARQLSSVVGDELFIVGSIETIRQIIQEYIWYGGSSEMIYIKQSEANTGEAIRNMIQLHYPNRFPISVIDSGAEEDLNLPARVAVYAMLNSAFLTTIGCTVAGITIYSLLILFERSKELAIVRALGGTKSQLLLTFILEAIQILVIGILIGTPLGIGTSVIVSKIITSYYDVPPLVINIPLLTLGLIVLGLFLISFIGAITPGFIASRKEINDLARAA